MMVRSHVCTSFDTYVLKRATKLLAMHRWSIWFFVDRAGNTPVAYVSICDGKHFLR
ncbi:hypothetical protein DPMN_030316 [Dreissena polymorpha]|uniref:Uncharacterized protein n=1 Tax=Dreissena polymorpha TaxID=45954 RepID=A0A9D4M2D8_DREPO|nr:hypothetical protein DPMN_030316 [Dreissena polymorpha]